MADAGPGDLRRRNGDTKTLSEPVRAFGGQENLEYRARLNRALQSCQWQSGTRECDFGTDGWVSPRQARRTRVNGRLGPANVNSGPTGTGPPASGAAYQVNGGTRSGNVNSGPPTTGPRRQSREPGQWQIGTREYGFRRGNRVSDRTRCAKQSPEPIPVRVATPQTSITIPSSAASKPRSAMRPARRRPCG